MGKKYEEVGKSILAGIFTRPDVSDILEKKANYFSEDDMPPARYDMLTDAAELEVLRDIINEVLEEIEYETRTFHKFPLIKND